MESVMTFIGYKLSPVHSLTYYNRGTVIDEEMHGDILWVYVQWTSGHIEWYPWSVFTNDAWVHDVPWSL